MLYTVLILILINCVKIIFCLPVFICQKQHHLITFIFFFLLIQYEAYILEKNAKNVLEAAKHMEDMYDMVQTRVYSAFDVFLTVTFDK